MLNLILYIGVVIYLIHNCNQLVHTGNKEAIAIQIIILGTITYIAYLFFFAPMYLYY